MRRIVLRSSKSQRDLLRPRIQVKKMYWDFHKGDADYNPSVPHGHSLDGKYKLELWSGRIYEISSGKIYGVSKPKEMRALYDLPGFREFVEECREEYRKMHPTMKLKPLTACTCNGSIIMRAKRNPNPCKTKERFILGITYQEARRGL